MEKIVKHLGEHLPPSVLYYDDIEKLVDILGESNSEVTVETKDYRLTSVKELKDLKTNLIRDLSVSSATPKVSISFTPGRTWLFAYEDTPSAKGLFEQVKQFVLSKRRRFTWTQNPLVGVVIGSLSWAVPMAYGKDFQYRGTLLIVNILIGVLWMIWAIEGRSRLHSTIYPLQERHLMVGFFAQNRDKLLVAIIGAILGSLITVTVNRMLK